MTDKINSNQRLTKSFSKKISESHENNYILKEDDVIYEEQNPVMEQVMELYGKEYDYSSLTDYELNVFLQYALDAYKKQDFSALHPDKLPIDLKIKLNSLPIKEEKIIKKKDKEKNTKEKKEYIWNDKFEMPSSKHDSKNIILEADINGCTVSARQFVEKLFHSYLLVAEKYKFKVELLESSDKKLSILISGDSAYKNFKFEKGLHYIKDKEFATNIFVSILPQTNETEKEIKINPNDLKIDAYHASGAGGQHINKTSSAIRITHIPTGIVVTCQEERSQIKNRNQAMKLLYVKLAELAEQKKEETEIIQRLEGHDTSKIRTYDLNNNTLTDHRIGLKISIEQGIEKFNIEKVTRKLNEILNKTKNNIEIKEER